MRKVLFFISALLLIGVINTQCHTQKEQHLYIISTNDIHASIDAMPQLATLITEYREQGDILLIDSGDKVSGNAYVDDATQPGLPIIELMNDLGYNIATLGNHEFDKGANVLNDMLNATDFTMVCANVRGNNEALSPMPHVIEEVDNLKIGFVGVVSTENNGRPLGGINAYRNYSFTPDIETAYNECANIAPHCDIVILLSHMGLDRDIQLAKQKPACCWIAGGHSHDIVNSDYDGVHISQNNKNLRYVTVADITHCNGEVNSISYEQVNMAEITPDNSLVQRIEQLKLSDPALNTIEAHATAMATKDGVANFTIASLAEYPYTDGFVPEITLYHYGGVRLDQILEGDIRRVDILNNDPFNSTIYIGTMTPSQMRYFIIRKYNSGTPEKPDKESHYPYFRSDVPYTIIVDSNGNATDIVFNLEERPYRVAMCNYIAENYIDSEIVKSQLVPTNISVRDAMLRHIATYREKGFTPDNRCYQIEEKAK